VTEYGKGWEFYQHEPVFWVKMFLFAVMGSSSLFVTTKAGLLRGSTPPAIRN
jgi:putative membrane protein